MDDDYMMMIMLIKCDQQGQEGSSSSNKYERNFVVKANKVKTTKFSREYVYTAHPSFLRQVNSRKKSFITYLSFETIIMSVLLVVSAGLSSFYHYPHKQHGNNNIKLIMALRIGMYTYFLYLFFCIVTRQKEKTRENSSRAEKNIFDYIIIIIVKMINGIHACFALFSTK